MKPSFPRMSPMSQSGHTTPLTTRRWRMMRTILHNRTTIVTCCVNSKKGQEFLEYWLPNKILKRKKIKQFAMCVSNTNYCELSSPEISKIGIFLWYLLRYCSQLASVWLKWGTSSKVSNILYSCLMHAIRVYQCHFEAYVLVVYTCAATLNLWTYFIYCFYCKFAARINSKKSPPPDVYLRPA